MGFEVNGTYFLDNNTLTITMDMMGEIQLQIIGSQIKLTLNESYIETLSGGENPFPDTFDNITIYYSIY